MAKIIEFIGPSGAGKSTVYNELNKFLVNNCNITSFVCSKVNKREGSRKVKKRFCKLFYYYEFIKCLEFDNEKYQNSLNKFLINNKILVNELWKAISNDNKHINNFDIRQESLNFTYNRIAETQLMIDSEEFEYIIHDDGLFHNSLFFCDRNKWFELNDFFSFFSKFYKPFKVIFFNIELDELTKRVKNRQVKTFLENNLNEEDLFEKCKQSILFYELKKDFLKKTKIDYLELNASLDVNEKVQMILSFLNKK